MKSLKTILTLGAATALLSVAITGPAFAEVSDETAYIFNTLSFLVMGFLVMWMAAGFCMLEAGLVRSRNAATICLKNVAIYALSGIMYWLVGYKLMYPGDMGTDWSGYLAVPSMWAPSTADVADGYASGSDWFFQMVFCATAASIVSGCLAERIKLWPFLIFTVVLTGVLYAVEGSWVWGGGWLATNYGFTDFAGSTVVHSTGGWAALTGAIVLGARTGKYEGGKTNPMPGSSLPLATLGTFILWLGWFGFNGGSQLALGSMADADAISNIFVNTNMAACTGTVAAMLLTQILYGKVDLTMALNGAIGGLVSITAAPLTPTIPMAAMVGAVGGVLVVIAVPLVDKLRIDDVVGAISAHLVCGIWGTMAVPLTNPDATFYGQAVGVVAVGAFMSIASLLFWIALKFTIGIRSTLDEERLGLDHSELGLVAYPEFIK